MNRSWIGRQKLLTLRGAPDLAPSLGEPKLEPQIEGTEVKIWTPALIGGFFQSMPKSSYCHELTVGCVDLLQKYSLRAIISLMRNKWTWDSSDGGPNLEPGHKVLYVFNLVTK